MASDRSAGGHPSSIRSLITQNPLSRWPMTIRDDLASLFAYTRWADARILEKVRLLSPEQYAQEPVPGWTSVRSSILHMGWAMQLWSRRLDGQEMGTMPTE